MKKILSAFSLAEILITMGVIGVIMAMTLPTIIQNYQKHKTISLFKKQYAVLAQGITMAASEYNIYSLGNNWSNLDEVMEVLSMYFNVSIKYPSNSGQEFDNFCVSRNTLSGFARQHKGIGYRFLGQNKFEHGMTSPITGCPSFVLSDGSCIGFTNGLFARTIAIDINGNQNGPNRSGYDLFFFMIDSSNSVKPYSTWWSNNSKRGCNKETYQSGWNCAQKIIEDGYKINYW